MTAILDFSLSHHCDVMVDRPVIDFEEPPLQAEIMMRSSMTLSLILNRQTSHYCIGRSSYWLLPLCTMKTSLSRTDVSAPCQRKSVTK